MKSTVGDLDTEGIPQVKPYDWWCQQILTMPAFPRLIELSKTCLKVKVGTNNAHSRK